MAQASNRLLTSPRRRMRKAYAVAFRVAWSYLRLYWGKRLLGQRWYDQRIGKLHIKNAERVKVAILALQGLFIKVGQLLSILANFLPEAFQQPLESLQDQVPARPYEEVVARIQRELGQTPDLLFDYFDPQPLAAASIGQTHRARLSDGTEVVVKVQHANIEAVAAVDMRIINRLQRIIAWWFEIAGMDHVYTQVQQMVEAELNFTAEAKAMQEIAENLADEAGLLIPQWVPALSTERVLTSHFCTGVKISNIAQLQAWEVDQTDLAERLLRLYCLMVFRDGYYHADPHPGNLLVQADGTLVLLDFGAVARLPTSTREALSRLIEAAVKNDVNGMIEASRAMGFIAPGREAEQLAERIIDALRTFLQQEIKLDGLNFKDIEVDPFNNSLFALIQNIGLTGVTSTVQIPKEYVLLNRMATLILGITYTLDPALNPLQVVRPQIQEYLLGQQGDLVTFVTKVVRDAATNVLGLPGELRTVLRQARKGQLEYQSGDTRRGSRLLYHGLRQLTFALLLIATGTLTYVLWQTQEVTLLRWSLAANGLLLWLLWRALRAGKRESTQ